MAGFEPASQGVKVPCLTTWLHLNISRADFGTVCRGRNLDECASNGIRTREPAVKGRCLNLLTNEPHGSGKWT